MRSVLLSALKSNSAGGRALVYGMSDEVVFSKVKVAIDSHGTRYRDFLVSMALLRKVMAFRNQLLHWVPFTNPEKTTLEAFVDANKHYKNPNQPQMICNERELRDLTKWLRLFEWDTLALLMALQQNERPARGMFRTADEAFMPALPLASYGPATKGANSMDKAKPAGKSQRQKFVDAAREHGADGNDETFKHIVRKVASAPPGKPKKAARKTAD
ncbi:MAG: hypothetical protein AB7O43_14875 [Hyphomicrobiaceae bacterium]